MTASRRGTSTRALDAVDDARRRRRRSGRRRSTTASSARSSASTTRAGARGRRDLRAEMIRVATERRRPVAGPAPRAAPRRSACGSTTPTCPRSRPTLESAADEACPTCGSSSPGPRPPPSRPRAPARGPARGRRRRHPPTRTARAQARADAVAGRARRRERARPRRSSRRRDSAMPATGRHRGARARPRRHRRLRRPGARAAAVDAPRTAGSTCTSRCCRAWRGAAPVQRALIAGDAEHRGIRVPARARARRRRRVRHALGARSRRTTPPGELLDALAVDGAELLAGVVDAHRRRHGRARRRSRASPRSRRSSASTTRGSTGRQPADAVDATASAASRPSPAHSRRSTAQRLKVLERAPRRPTPRRSRPGALAARRPASARRHRDRRRSSCCACSPPDARRWPRPTGGAARRDGGGAMSGRSGAPARRRDGRGRGPQRGRGRRAHLARAPRRVRGARGRARRRGLRQPAAARRASAERGLDRADAALATELTYGTLRMQGYYDEVIALAAGRPTIAIDPAVLDVLRLGAHQLLATRVPTHAAVDESVALAQARRRRRPPASPTRVLRTISRTTPEEWRELVRRGRDGRRRRLAGSSTSHPAWIVRALRAALAAEGRGDELDAAARRRQRRAAGEPRRAAGTRRRRRRRSPGSSPTGTRRSACVDGGDPLGVAEASQRSHPRAGRGLAARRARADAAPARSCRGSAGSTSAPAPAARRRCSRPRRSPAVRRCVANELVPARAELVRKALVGRARRRRGARTATAASSTSSARRSGRVRPHPARRARAPVSARCAAAPRRAGASARATSPSSRGCRASCSTPRVARAHARRRPRLRDLLAAHRRDPRQRRERRSRGCGGRVEQLDTRAVLAGAVAASARPRRRRPRPCSSGRTGTAPTRCSSRCCDVPAELGRRRADR